MASIVGCDESLSCLLSHSSSAKDTGKQHVATRKADRTSIKCCRAPAAAACQDEEVWSACAADNCGHNTGQSGRMLIVSNLFAATSSARSTDSLNSTISLCRFVGFSDVSKVKATSRHRFGSAASQHKQISKQAVDGRESSCCTFRFTNCNFASRKKTRSKSLTTPM